MINLDKIDKVCARVVPLVKREMTSVDIGCIDAAYCRKLQAIYLPLTRMANTYGQQIFLGWYHINHYLGEDVAFINRSIGHVALDKMWTEDKGPSSAKDPAALCLRCLSSFLVSDEKGDERLRSKAQRLLDLLPPDVGSRR